MAFKSGFVKKGLLYRHAVPDDAEQLARLYDTVYKGGYPLKDCLDPAVVRDILETERHIWMVAADGDQVVGATVSKPDTWNRSYETCRSVTAESHGGKGIGTFLYDMALHAAFLKDDCDLTYGYPRTKGMKELMERPNPPITVVGTDLGMHLVSEQREIHLLSLLFNPFRQIRRIVEPDPLHARSPSLKELVDGFRLPAETGAYPPDAIVGPSGGSPYESDHGRMTYSHFAPSKCAAITSVAADDDEGIVRTLWDFIHQAKQSGELEHLSFYMLADKKGLLSRLREPTEGGLFRISAYLPAWYNEDGRRYDCLNMAVRLDRQRAKMYETEAIVDSFHDMYTALPAREGESRPPYRKRQAPAMILAQNSL